jgi:hypothetical protein
MVTKVTGNDDYKSEFYSHKIFIMKKNMGNFDRAFRVLIAITIAGFYFTKLITATWANVLLIIAAVFILTSVISFCPLYKIFQINTLENNKKMQA